jgi:hypothetical protein
MTLKYSSSIDCSQSGYNGNKGNSDNSRALHVDVGQLEWIDKQTRTRI